jgi:Fe-S-cluster containining protein
MTKGSIRARTAHVDLTCGGRKLHFQLTVPTGPTPPVELLPLFQSITDMFVSAAVEDVEATGGEISCRKGCGACCRQLVPVSEIEIESIRRLVEALPQPRRLEIIARFEQALQRLSEAGLLESLRMPERVCRESVLSIGTAYFQQGVACPFLEHESCSIHSARPLACREYLVTSPATNCAQPSAKTIHCVPVPAKVSRAVRHLDTGKANPSATWIPMILALEWHRPDREDADPPPGTLSIARVFEQLSGQPIPNPDDAFDG